MENLETQPQEQTQLQPEIEQRYDPSLTFTTAELPVDEGIQDDAPVNETVITESPELIELRAKYEELANKAPEVQYAIPDELIEKAVNPETFQDIVRISTMNSADVIKQSLKEANPWATTDRDLDALLQESFPDYDPEIPENYGMDDVKLKQFNYIAEGLKSQMLSDVTAKLKEDFKSFVTAPIEEAPFDEKAFEAEVSSHIESSIAAYKAPEIPAIDGYNLNTTVDMNKVREIAAASANGPFYATKEGKLMPDVEAIADRVLLNQIREQLKPMADALLRKAPEVTKDAILRSLNNAPPAVQASGPDPNTYRQRQPERYEGIKIASVSN